MKSGENIMKNEKYPLEVHEIVWYKGFEYRINAINRERGTAVIEGVHGHERPYAAVVKLEELER